MKPNVERIYTADELEQVAKEFLTYIKELKQLPAGEPGADTTQALVVGLSGNLGAGKTTLVQNCAKLLGVEEHVTSPTFVIQKTYQTKDSIFKSLVHIDAYRLESSRELAVLGIAETVLDPTSLIFIEWPEKVADILPQGTIQVQISSIDESTRKMIFNDRI